MKFVCYYNWDQLPESANVLFVQGEKENLFYSSQWFKKVTATLENDQAMMLACVVADDQVLAILPLIQLSKENFLSLKHRYATHFSLLLAEEDQSQVLACLVKGLEKLPARSLLLEPVADDDNKMIVLQDFMQQAGYQCQLHFRTYNWIYRLQNQSFVNYLAGRPSRLRNTISRKSRKLDREHGYEMRLFIGDDVPHAMCDYYAVFTSSWKANEQFVEFLNSVVEGFSRAAWSRLGVLYVKNKPVAAQLWFVVHGKASIFRLAYDEAWKSYSPGSILTSFMMEYVIDTDKISEIDFLTGNEAYKQDWMSERRERFALSCVKTKKPDSWYESIVKSLMGKLKRR
ncbi:MAG: GNAT family N-acetyltransferase [Gammaproteobacteria bacterium]|nr:GNAT family N-acetyltransferase [Gammaproteobacteria bacterium]